MHFVWLARSGHMTVPAYQQMCHAGITHIITPSTTTTTHPHITPLPPPLPLPTHHVSARTRHTMPQEHQNGPKTTARWLRRQEQHDMKRGGHNVLKTRRTQRNTQGATRRGHRGTEKQWAGRTRYVRLFFLFFSCLLTSPPLLAPPIPPPPPSLPPKDKEHSYEGVFFVFGKFSTPHHHETRKTCSVPSSSNHTHETCPYGHVLCVWLLLCHSQPSNTKNAPFCRPLCYVPSPFPSFEHEKTRHFRRVFRVWRLHHPPFPSNTKNVPVLAHFFGHLHPPSLCFTFPPLPPHTLPCSSLSFFSFLGTYYLGNYYFR